MPAFLPYESIFGYKGLGGVGNVGGGGVGNVGGGGVGNVLC